MPKNVYIHIPFCKSKCKYCSFISICDKSLIEAYVEALEKDIQINYENESLNTIYFGGGTPSLLTVNKIEKILSLFKFDKNSEITIEINPENVNLTYMKNLKAIGINRISIGSQSFNDEILKIIGRIHTSKQVKQTIDYAIKAGFENINVDLIYGLPLQTIDILKQDIDEILNLGIQHISTYGLKIDENSTWYKKYNSDKNLIIENEKQYKIADEDEQAEMYELINETFEQQKYLRYEVSNFALEGFESKHNLNYWNNNEYYGFGASSHGYKNNTRYSKENNVRKYILNPEKYAQEHLVSKQEQLEEEIFLGFRKTSGINIKNINEKFNIDFDKKYNNILNKYKDYFVKTSDGYTFNLNGILISNVILSEFLL